MRSYKKELWFDIPTRRAFVNITPLLEECPGRAAFGRAFFSITPCTSGPVFSSTMTGKGYMRTSSAGLRSLLQRGPEPLSSQGRWGMPVCTLVDRHGQGVVVAVMEERPDPGPWVLVKIVGK